MLLTIVIVFIVIIVLNIIKDIKKDEKLKENWENSYGKDIVNYVNQYHPDFFYLYINWYHGYEQAALYVKINYKEFKIPYGTSIPYSGSIISYIKENTGYSSDKLSNSANMEYYKFYKRTDGLSYALSEQANDFDQKKTYENSSQCVNDKDIQNNIEEKISSVEDTNEIQLLKHANRQRVEGNLNSSVTNIYTRIKREIDKKCLYSGMKPFQVRINGVGGYYSRYITVMSEENQKTEQYIRDYEIALNHLPISISWNKVRVEDGTLLNDELKYDFIINVGKKYIEYFYYCLISDGFFLSVYGHFSEEQVARMFMKKILENHIDILEKIEPNKDVVVTRYGVRERISEDEQRIMFKFSDYGLKDFNEDWQTLGFLMAYCNYKCGVKNIDSMDEVIGHQHNYYYIQSESEFSSSYMANLQEVNCNTIQSSPEINLNEW